MQRQGQPIRLDGPERHLIEKKGTPTMGGLLILCAMTISTLLWVDLRNGYVWAVLFVTLGYGALGFCRRLPEGHQAQHQGRPGRVKLVVQAVIGLVAAVWIASLTRGPLGTALAVPVFKEVADPARLLLPGLRHAGDDGRVERGEPDRRAGRPGDRADHDRRRRVRADRLPGRQPHLRRLPAAHLRAGGRRTGGVLLPR